MDLIGFLLQASRGLVGGIVLAGLMSGGLGAALIVVIHRALIGSDRDAMWVVSAFLLVAVGKVLSHYASQLMLVRLAQDSILSLCRSISRKILEAKFQKLESLGQARILATLTDDVVTLSAAIQSVPALATNLTVVAGCAVYLLWLSWQVFVVSFVMVLLGVAAYRVLLSRAHAAIEAAREGRDRLFSDFRTLIDGIKELKLHRARREEFVRTEVDVTTEFLRRQNFTASRQYLLADAWTQALFYSLVGMLLFAAPAFSSASNEALTGYVFAALYMMTPVWTLIGSVPVFIRGRVALAKIRSLDSELGGADEFMGQSDIPVTEQVTIRFEEISFTYISSTVEENEFKLGPLNLELASGEVVFVTGGNGSGKSTLVKLLTGLYTPQAGRILLNEMPVDDSNRGLYREHFSVVFADFYLFKRLFGVQASRRGDEISAYLESLGMDRKVKVERDQFSTISLSSGQRRRLALLTAYMEDRPVYVFDEWAADQDPSYKEVFYTQLLPELKARGKCVIVVTHDDRYFSRGDRILRLEGGQLREPSEKSLAAKQVAASC
jgi:putative ATP-binding cassette transporter